MKHQIVVRAAWDAKAQVWVATSDDVQGLAIEAATVAFLGQKVVSALQDLVELNGLDSVSSKFQWICAAALGNVLSRCPLCF